MKINRKKTLVISSVIGLALLLIIAVLFFRPPTYSNTENTQDYTHRQQSEFAIDGDSSGVGYNPLSIDVEKCSYGKDAVYFGFGHTEFAIDGHQGNDCIFKYGTEIENPTWDGSLDTMCKVPAAVAVSLSVSSSGINFSPISQYCSKI